MIIRDYDIADEEKVVDLWHRCGLVQGAKDPRRDIARKLEAGRGCILVGQFENEIVATAMVGYEGHRGWINYVAVSPEHQHRGFGRRIMQKAEELLRAEGCPKINLQVRKNNLAVLDFYRRLGYEVDELVSMGKRLN